MNQIALFLPQVFGHTKNTGSALLLAAAHFVGTPLPQPLEAKHDVGKPRFFFFEVQVFKSHWSSLNLSFLIY